MRLHGTPPSHFTRKVRVVLQELGVPYEFVIVPDLLVEGSSHFGDNPLQRFPVLEDGAERLIESDLICEYLISGLGKGKELNSFLPCPEQRTRDQQRLAIMNGGMAAGVNLLRAKRSGVGDWGAFPFFRQELGAIRGALDWLERDLGARTSYYPGRLTMLDVALMCFAQWAEFREFLGPWSKVPNLERFVRAHENRPSFKATHPALAEVTR